MLVTSPPGSGELYIPHNGDQILVPPDEAVEVPEDIGKNLVAQGWISGDSPRQTIAEVMEWVGDDPTRAQAVLAEEQSKDDPRSSLVGKLQAIIDKETS